MGRKPWGESPLCTKDIPALLGEKKGPLVTFRVSVGRRCDIICGKFGVGRREVDHEMKAVGLSALLCPPVPTL